MPSESLTDKMLPKSLRHLKTQILLFCLLQGVLSLVVGLYTLTYLPEVLEAETVKAEPEVRRTEIHKTKLSDITKTLTSEEGETFVLFRFDKFVNGFESDVSLDLMTGHTKYPYFSSGYKRDDIPEWFNVKDTFCGGCLTIHGKRLGYLRDATINPELASGNVGGEELTNIMHQPLETEYLQFKKGFFQTSSDQTLEVSPTYTLNIELRTFLNALKQVPRGDNDVRDIVQSRDKTAVMVTRYEYANFYHSTMNWYDTFLIMILYNIHPTDIDVFWADAHPRSKLDDIWDTLFGKCKRVRKLWEPLTYKHMVWNGMGERSPINAHKMDDLPYVNEYRHFVLSRYSINPKHVINCKQLRVSIIWRRSYVAHPRNPDGFIPRQIYNEDEVWETVSNTLPSAIVNGIQLDKLTMSEQLELMTSTDILIGMHGAGLSHILYLPSTSGVIELFTRRTSVGNAHFRAMARWRRLPYTVWINSNGNYEMSNHRTKVPAQTLKEMVQTIETSLCGNHH